MADKTAIEWSDATWTPIRARHKVTNKVGWHCEHDSPGCVFCYSEDMNERWGTGLPFKPGHRQDIDIFLDEKMLLAPLRWKSPRKIFVCSMTDLFADFVPDEWIDRMFAVMALAPQHTFQVLTKRSARMRRYCTSPGRLDRIVEAADPLRVATGERVHSFDWPAQNVWLGVSAEDQQRADERIPDLLATPAAIRFVSYEPALAPVRFDRIRAPRYTPDDDGWTFNCLDSGDTYRLFGDDGRYLDSGDGPYRDGKIDQIIYGGESGSNRRDSKIEWAEATMAACAAAGTAFFFKQDGAFQPGKRGRASDKLWAMKEFPR
jgi:protein gp37